MASVRGLSGQASESWVASGGTDDRSAEVRMDSQRGKVPDFTKVFNLEDIIDFTPVALAVGGKRQLENDVLLLS